MTVVALVVDRRGKLVDSGLQAVWLLCGYIAVRQYVHGPRHLVGRPPVAPGTHQCETAAEARGTGAAEPAERSKLLWLRVHRRDEWWQCSRRICGRRSRGINWRCSYRLLWRRCCHSTQRVAPILPRAR